MTPPVTVPATGKHWTLAELIALASAQYPELASVRARADVARGKLLQAGLYPNPTVTLRADDVGNPNGAAGLVAVTVIQEVVTAHKLKLNREAAAHGVAAAEWQAITRWYDVLTRLRLAYVEVLTAQREVRAFEDIVRLATDGWRVAEKVQKAGVGSRQDVLRAKVELEQSRIRLGVSQRRAEAAWRQLALAVGVPHLEAGEVAGQLESLPPRYEWQEVVQAVLTRSSEVQEAQALNQQAEGLWRRAKVEPIPNLFFQVRPIYSFPDRTMEAMVEVGAALPLYNRNQGNIASARADIVRTAADVQLIELRLAERLNVAFQRYLAAFEQVEAYRLRILPDAEESLQLVRLGYEKGDPKNDYTAVLQAQVILSQAKLAYTQGLGELWRSVCDVAGLLQEDQLEVAEPRR